MLMHKGTQTINTDRLILRKFKFDDAYDMFKNWSNGIMSESLKAVIDYLFSETQFNRIAARHDTNNIASGKVMVKSGMEYEGTLRQVKLRNNKDFYDLALYAILKDDWIKSKEQISY